MTNRETIKKDLSTLCPDMPDKVLYDLVSFISKTRAEAREEVLKEVVAKVERWKYQEGKRQLVMADGSTKDATDYVDGNNNAVENILSVLTTLTEKTK